jgi:hypothetical protein
MNLYNSPLPPPSGKSPEAISNGDSAQMLLRGMIVDLNIWLMENHRNGHDEGKQWTLSAMLADGQKLSVDKVSSRGPSLLRIEGETEAGGKCLLLAHKSSVQFMAAYRPCTKEEAEHREIGFHAIIADERIEQPRLPLNLGK